MKAEAKNIDTIFGILKKIIIPAYQRNYSWSKVVAEQLFNDIIDLVNSNIAISDGDFKNMIKEHFIGPIVSIIHTTEESSRILIDGQQRLTTIIILLIALKNLVKNDKIEVKNKELFVKEIENQYLVNQYSEEQEEKIKLKPYNKDNEIFLSLFDETFREDETNKMVVNYLMFKDLLEQEYLNGLDIDILFKTIKTKIIFVDIILSTSENDNAQEIFESLNSKGQDLTNSDLIRNLILMDKPEREQDRLYKTYWEKIENNTRKNSDSKMEEFIRDYLIYINPSKISKIGIAGDIYKNFKDFMFKVKNEEQNINSILDDLLRFSQYYNFIINANHTNSRISNQLKIINKLEITVSYPFLLYVFELNYKNLISEDDILNTLKLIESYTFRRIFTDGTPTNSLNKTFYQLRNNFKNYTDEDVQKNYYEILKSIFINKTGSTRFPNNEEFISGLVKKDIYSQKQKNKVHLFENLEKYNSKEYINFAEKLDNRELSIEHIMPQTLTENWKKDLGDNYKEVYQEYLHTLGNLTITCYNSDLSNKSFKDKLEIYKDSNIHLTRDIYNDYNETKLFNKKSIEQRAKKLAEIATKIWEYPTTTYKNNINEETFSIYDVNEFISKKPESFTFLGEEYYSTHSWKEMLKIILDQLIDLDPDKIVNFAKSNNSTYFRYGKDDDNSKNFEIFNEKYNLFLYKSKSTEAIFSIIKKVFEFFNLKEEDLIIKLKNSEKNNS